jgi:hypothetical protein
MTVKMATLLARLAATVRWLTEPRRLVRGRYGPMVCGVMSDAAQELREKWLGER